VLEDILKRWMKGSFPGFQQHVNLKPTFSAAFLTTESINSRYIIQTNLPVQVQ
jgi:hypothetical protein